ncbi:hypothetical protein [Streptomyces sp. NRRL F-5630]|uniref:hypothetical protein n=1 Tax=Streptomyces sp. NRRL F-5630 TaxID=1463864 RepID=UPI000AEFC3DE|nr:hypothetical protein [Streptomyces sp. NRRL F-5630]
MNKYTRRLVFRRWAVQFDRPVNPHLVHEANAALMQEFPHLFAPDVPETFRGPKWGTR